MIPRSRQFFEQVVNTPSPSGFEERVAEVVRDYASDFADQIRTDVHGNVAAILNPHAETRIMLAGHMDEIGFIVHHIDEHGMLSFKTIGGHDPSIIVGQRVWVHGKERVPGVIGRKAIHLLTEEERRKRPELYELWIDIGAKDQADAESVVKVGDCATYQWEFQYLRGDRATARGFDNKMGTFIVMEALRLLKESGELDPHVGVYGVATVQEEIGLRGAQTSSYWIGAQVGIAVDVNHANDIPGIQESRYGKLDVGSGPSVMRGANANPIVFDMITKAAAAEAIPYQVDVEPGGTGTDGNAMQLNRGGMAVGIMGVPLRYMHTPCELLSVSDVVNCSRLMAAFCKRVSQSTDFTPRVL
jgi:endoglucanase